MASSSTKVTADSAPRPPTPAEEANPVEILPDHELIQVSDLPASGTRERRAFRRWLLNRIELIEEYKGKFKHYNQIPLEDFELQIPITACKCCRTPKDWCCHRKGKKPAVDFNQPPPAEPEDEFEPETEAEDELPGPSNARTVPIALESPPPSPRPTFKPMAMHAAVPAMTEIKIQMPVLANKLKSKENYSAWDREFKNWARFNGVLGQLDGTNPRPGGATRSAALTDAHGLWDRLDQKVLAGLHHSTLR